MSNIALRNTPIQVTQIQTTGGAVAVTGSFNGTTPNQGDLILCVYSEAGGGAVVPTAPTQSGGYQVGGSQVKSSSKCAWWYAQATGSDVAPVVTPTSAFNGSACVLIYILSGAKYDTTVANIIDVSATITDTVSTTLNPSTSPTATTQVDFGFSVYARFHTSVTDTLTSDTGGWTNDFMSSGTSTHTHHFASVHSPYVNNFAFQHNTATFGQASTQECAMLVCILPAPPTDTDAGNAGVDSTGSVHAAISSSDPSNAGADTGSITHATQSSSDPSNAGADASVSIKPPTQSDAGTGNDAGEKTSIIPIGDTGAGVDAGSITHATQSSSDVGTGSDAGELVHASVSSTDAGTGVDSNGSATVHISSTDTGSGNDVNSPVPATLSSTDTGTGNDSGITIGISQTGASGDFTGAGGITTVFIYQTGADGDFTNAAITVFISATGAQGDFSNASDAIIALVSDNDTGSGDDETGTTPITLSDVDATSVNDAGAHIGLADSDALEGLELLAWSIGVHDGETATGTEVDGTHGIPITDPDTGHGIDASSLAVSINDSDNRTVIDAEQVTHRTLSDGDLAQGIDASALLTLPISSSDTGHGTDASAMGIASSDANGPTTEAVQAFHIIANDSEQGSFDEQGHQGFFRFGDDTGTGTDFGQVTHATRSDSDAGHGTERQDAENPSATYYVMEAQSFSHAAILSPVTGLEVAPLYACRSATLTPVFDSLDNTQDDSLMGTWYSLRSAELSVTAGFISWQALADIGGTAISGPDASGKYGLSLWREFMGSNPEVPVILSAPARDLHFAPELSWHDIAGGGRSFTIVLYAVRLKGFSIDSVSYKTGVQFSYGGTAIPSSTDEAGNPLPGSYYSGQTPTAPGTGLSIGRILSTPGQAVAAGAVPQLALFGQGT